MTTEQLRLEIQVQVKEALKDLSTVSGSIKGLAKETQSATPKADALKATMGRLQEDLRSSGVAAAFFGDKAGGLRERQALLRQAMIELIQKGIHPQTAQMQSLKADYDAAAQAARKLEDSTRGPVSSMDALNKKLEFAGGVVAITAVARGIGELGKNALDTAGRYEMLTANFETLTGSAAGAQAVFEKLKGFANKTPFDLEGVANAGKQLMAAKVPMADLQTRLGQLGDLSLGNKQKFESMTAAFSKMSTKGKVDMEQLNIFLEAGVPVLDELAAGFGTTSDKVFDMMSRGKVSTADFVAAMGRLTGEGAQFFGGMARGAATYEGVLSTMRDAIDGAAASMGALLLPAVKAVAQLVTGFFSLVEASPLLKGLIVGSVIGLSVVLVGLAAKTWLVYAAEMAVNAARAVGNPLLLVGIAAAGAATVAVAAYAASQSKAAKAANEASQSTRDGARAAKEYEDSLKRMSVAELEAAKASLAHSMSRSSSQDGLTEASKMIKAMEDEIKRKKDTADKESKEERNKKAAAWKDSWANEFGKHQASLQGPAAEIEFERAKKLADAKANFVQEANQEVLDQINAYYDAKRTELLAKQAEAAQDQVAREEAAAAEKARSDRARLAELSGSRLAVVEAERSAYLESAKDEGALRQAVLADYEVKLAQARRADAVAAFDAANKERAFAAGLTESRLDDLSLERDRTLELFEGTELQKAALAAKYERDIARLTVEEAEKANQQAIESRRKAFDTMKEEALKNSQWGDYAGAKAADLAKDTELGKIIGLGGQPALDWKQVLLDSALNLAMQNESAQKVMNIFSTALTGLVNWALAPLADILVWLYDVAVVPLGNGIIWVINGLIKGINKVLDFFKLKTIQEIQSLQTSKQIQEQQKRIADKSKAVSDAMDSIRKTFDDRRKDIEDAYSKNVGSLKNLLELGAMSEATYAERIDALNATKVSDLAVLSQTEKDQLAVLKQILDTLGAGKEATDAALHAAGVPGYAVGAIEIPQTHTAIVHKGETIIPAPFAEGLRRGELSLGKGSGGTVIQVSAPVHVAGSVVAMDDLVDTVGTRMSRRIKRGLLEVGA